MSVEGEVTTRLGVCGFIARVQAPVDMQILILQHKFPKCCLHKDVENCMNRRANNGRKRPQINKQKFHFFRPASLTFFMCVFRPRITNGVATVVVGRPFLMNKYGKFSSARARTGGVGRKVCSEAENMK